MSRNWYDMAPLEPLIESGYMLLTPNLRLARRLRAQWDKRCLEGGARVWEPLRVQPLESWLQQQWEQALVLDLVPALTPISQGQALEVWQQCIEEQERLTGAYHLLRPAGAAQLCQQARDTLIRWQVKLNDARIRQEFNLDVDCATFLSWHGPFERRLAAAGQCTTVDCIARLSDCAASLPRVKVALLEFDDVPPLYQSVVNALGEGLQELRHIGEPGTRHAHAFGDKRAELQAVAHWAAGIHRADPGATVGVVLSDMAGDRAALEYLMRREFDCLGADYTSLPVNFSTGIPLERTPVVRDALAVLALGLQRTTVAAVVAVMRSRFLHMPDAGTDRAICFVSRLFEAGQEQLDIGDLRFAASRVKLDPADGAGEGLLLGQHLMAMGAMRELRQSGTPLVWVERFSQALDIWGWPGAGPLDSLEYQQVELWYRTLEEFGSYDTVCSALDYPAALQLLSRCCSRQMSQPRTQDSSVQVLGPLEAAGLAFDHLWLCGVQAGNWPAPVRPNPFIPQTLQRQRQMPHATAEREWLFAETLFNQYSRCTPALHASYTRMIDGIGELPSALLQDFSWVPVAPVPAVNPRWLQLRQQHELEHIDDDRAPPLDAIELTRTGGGSGLLEDQSHCPFRAFARRRLLVEPLGAFSVALSAAERGSIVHDALYVLWGEIGDHATLVSLHDEGRAAVIDTAVQAALDAVPDRRRRSLGRSYWALEGRHLAGLLQEWLQVEGQRTGFVVHQREEALTLELQQLQIHLRLDRIDQLADGSRAIIDYKTGTGRVQDWLGERPAKPQLLLYGIAEPSGASALAFAQLRPRDCRYVGLGRSAIAQGVQTDIGRAVGERMAASDWDTLNNRWRENLQRLAAEFIAGQAQVDPLAADSCTWCGLQPLCRIGLDQQAMP